MHEAPAHRWTDNLPFEPKNRIDEAPWLFRSWYGTAGLGLGLLGARAAFDGPDEASWHGGVLFDDWAQDGLRADSPDDRDRAADLSDIAAGSVVAWLVLDTVLTRGRDNQADAWRMTLNALLTQGIVETTVKHFAGRERPDGSDNRSFYSGHAALTATAAGLICAHHLGGGLYGQPAADRWACAGAVSAAVAAGSLRVAADKHYATDVLVGWGSGFVLGYLLPRRWYYREPSEGDAVALSVLPAVGRDRASLIVGVHW